MSFIKQVFHVVFPKRRQQRVIELRPTVEMRSVYYKHGMRIYSLSQCRERTRPRPGKLHAPHLEKRG